MSTTEVNAFAAMEQKGALEPFSFELGELGPDQVDIKVEYCGICHSDLSMLNNEWGMSQYPLVPGHEVVGRVAAAGEFVHGIKVGDLVGLGWYSGSCMHCNHCMDGDHNLCGSIEGTLVGRHGGFADVVRCQWTWATPIPESLDAGKAGPLFCGGITVFNPIVQSRVQPTDRVGVIGIGGLGHLAVQFLAKWGCEVTAFTSSPDKADEAKRMGAHQVVSSRDDEAMAKVAGAYDFILNTTNANLNWDSYLNALGPRGVLHTVGAVPDPIPAPAFTLISGQKSISGSPLGSPALTRKMLEFCARHGIETVTEEFPMKDVNEAMAHLEANKARYRVVLKA